MQDFFEAFINERHKVLGKNLKPFCLNHCLYLEAIESPFMKIINGDEVSVSRKDLELAVLICSADRDILSAVKNPYAIKNIQMKFHKFKRGLTAFLGYLTDFLTIPDVWDKSEGETTLNSPWILSKATLLLTKTNMTHSEIWSMPLGQLLWYSACIAELEGVVEIQSEAEKQALDELERNRKK